MADRSKKDSHYLPCLIVIVGIILAILAWYTLSNKTISPHLLDSFMISVPLLVLITGILFSIVIAITVKLIQLTRERAKSYELMSANFQNEIFERVRSEETKQKLEKALLQGQKLQAIGTLAGGIAHDFNNILYAIIGYAEMVRDDIAKDSLSYKNLGKVIEGSHRGQELIARILTFSRRQHHDFTHLKIKDTLESVLSLLRPAIPSSVTIELEGGNQMIQGNQTQLHQVIVNLINNAVDAMDGEGTVKINISNVLHHDPVLKQFPKSIDSDYCRIDVIDTGHGMDQAMVGRIFEPFFTTKEVGKGTGLGLSTVHAIMEEHHGEILVVSRLGHGTTFTLLLPEYKENTNG